MPCPSHTPSVYHSGNIWRGVHITKLLAMQFLEPPVTTFLFGPTVFRLQTQKPIWDDKHTGCAAVYSDRSSSTLRKDVQAPFSEWKSKSTKKANTHLAGSKNAMFSACFVRLTLLHWSCRPYILPNVSKHLPDYKALYPRTKYLSSF
jgi:hypothetical protein